MQLWTLSNWIAPANIGINPIFFHWKSYGVETAIAFSFYFRHKISLVQKVLSLIKKHLTTNGIFVSNLPSSFDIFNKKNKFALSQIELYRKNFENVDIYNGETSNKIYYKSFFDVDEIVYDVTNMILISSDKKYEIKNNGLLDEIVDIKPYLGDLSN